MNYYIQGNKDKADQIKAAFEKLGIDVLDFGFADKTLVYCSIGGVCVQSLPYSINLMNILHSHPDYKELELPVQPKFNVGDWIACDADSFTLSIKSVRDANYYFHQGASLPIKDIDEHYHLWTIQDAKDGDVLVYQGEIFLCNLVGNNSVLYHCCFDGELVVHSFYAFSNEDLIHVHPATKEQRDLLFKKMKEAGYEWDADKKELRKIKPHYDIANFSAGMPVLVREYDTCHWQWVQYSHFNGVGLFFAAGKTWRQCIPFNEETKHLLGTTDMPSEEYINW